MKEPVISRSTPFWKNGVVTDLLIIAFLWTSAIFFVNPLGDFPLNDDWSYGGVVQRMIEEGSYHPSGWTAMPLVTQALWGALFCLPFGFSFTTIRFSTLFLSLVGIFAVYLLIRQLYRPRWLAVTVALTLAFNPVYFALSHTFMTDVPFTAFTSVALLLFLMSLQLQSDRYLILGTCLSTAAILCRQVGLFLPIAFGLSLLAKHGISWRWLIRATIPPIIGSSSLLGFNGWLKTTGVLPVAYVSKTETWLHVLLSPGLLFRNVVEHTAGSLLYLGLFLFPILIIMLPRFLEEQNPRRRRLVCSIVSLFIIFSSIGLILYRHIMPVGGNTLIREGIGPITLHDVYILKLPHMSPLPSWFWMVITLTSILGGALIVASVISFVVDFFSHATFLQKSDDRINSFFFLSGAAVYLMLMVVTVGFFDRYLLPVIPLFCGGIVSFAKSPSPSDQQLLTKGAMILLCFLMVFSIATTHDYLAWNRARWEALTYLIEREHVAPLEIDGGFEFNGLYLYSPDHTQLDRSKSWWWVYDDKYIVAMGELPGDDIIRKYSFSRWFPPQKGNILLLRRKVESSPVDAADKPAQRDAPSDAHKPRR